MTVGENFTGDFCGSLDASSFELFGFLSLLGGLSMEPLGVNLLAGFELSAAGTCISIGNATSDDGLPLLTDGGELGANCFVPGTVIRDCDNESKLLKAELEMTCLGG